MARPPAAFSVISVPSRPVNKFHPGHVPQLRRLPGVALLPENSPVSKCRIVALGIRKLHRIKAPPPRAGNRHCKAAWRSICNISPGHTSLVM